MEMSLGLKKNNNKKKQIGRAVMLVKKNPQPPNWKNQGGDG